MAYIITGEKIQNMCDLYLGFDKNSFKFNPFIFQQKHKHLYYENIEENFKNPTKIFCYTDCLQNVKVLIETLNKFKNEFVLILHNSDQNFNKEHLVLFNKIKKLKKVFTQNMNVIHNDVYPLPIGIANHMWTHGNLNTFHKVLNNDSITKVKNIFFNFNISTNKHKRKECYEKIKQKRIPFLQNQSFEQYLVKLKSHKFCVCPEGNGIDCHRFWECLYLRVIPICKKNILVSYYSQYFPIVILNNWEDLVVNNLDYNGFHWNNYDNLDLKFLENTIH